jgi:sporulation protein YlmC with PRC-barrel domain
MTVKKTAAHRGHAKKVPTLSRLRDIGRAVSSSDEDIRGRMVKDKNGQDLGRIEDLLVDDVKWKVRFMEVASGGILGFGDSKSFIPVDAITRMTADNVYISHTLEHVAGAPRYDPTLVAIDVNYLMELYPSYGSPGSFGLLP